MAISPSISDRIDYIQQIKWFFVLEIPIRLLSHKIDPLINGRFSVKNREASFVILKVGIDSINI